jgi:hypothetical protein
VFRQDVDPQNSLLAILGMFNWMPRWYQVDHRRSLIDIGEDLIRLALAALGRSS